MFSHEVLAPLNEKSARPKKKTKEVGATDFPLFYCSRYKVPNKLTATYYANNGLRNAMLRRRCIQPTLSCVPPYIVFNKLLTYGQTDDVTNRGRHSCSIRKYDRFGKRKNDFVAGNWTRVLRDDKQKGHRLVDSLRNSICIIANPLNDRLCCCKLRFYEILR